jgi:hypothetical protein
MTGHVDHGTILSRLDPPYSAIEPLGSISGAQRVDKKLKPMPKPQGTESLLYDWVQGKDSEVAWRRSARLELDF